MKTRIVAAALMLGVGAIALTGCVNPVEQLINNTVEDAIEGATGVRLRGLRYRGVRFDLYTTARSLLVTLTHLESAGLTLTLGAPLRRGGAPQVVCK